MELALTMPLLLLFLCGIIDFGRMYNAQIVLTEAAREGARAAVVSGTAAAVKGRVDRVVTKGGATVQSPLTLCPSAQDEAVVTLGYDFAFVTPFVMISGMFGDSPDDTVKLTATGVMAC